MNKSFALPPGARFLALERIHTAVWTLLLFTLTNQVARAGSATWKFNPTSKTWNDAANWKPATVPNGPADTATFGRSQTTAISLSAMTEAIGLTFESRAGSFSITAGPGFALTVSGGGITNNSGMPQTFIAATEEDSSDSGSIVFTQSATTGSQTRFMIGGGRQQDTLGASIEFDEGASADATDFVLEGGTNFFTAGGHLLFANNSAARNMCAFQVGGGHLTTSQGATVEFADKASVAGAKFTLRAGDEANAFGGNVLFEDNSIVTDSAFHILAGKTRTAFGGFLQFSEEASAGNSIIVNEGGDHDFNPALTEFIGTSTAQNATVILNGGRSIDSSQAVFFEKSDAAGATLIAHAGVEGSGGAGGRLDLRDDCVAGQTRIIVYGYPSHVGDGSLDITIHNGPLTVGSIEGNGTVQLGRHDLSVGTRNISTTFSGQIVDFFGESALTKVGTATLTLTAASTYGGGTVVNNGTLQIDNATGSGTGAGPVNVNGGTLSGRGIIAGALTIGSGHGPGAILAPGQGETERRTLTGQSSVIFAADGSYVCQLDTEQVKADQIAGAGITIDPAALFSLRLLGNTNLPAGIVFIVINNFAATPIAGVFANLADGATITAGGNTFQADYAGGDGNDLTLTSGVLIDNHASWRNEILDGVTGQHLQR
jgi:autotransporter-associated beta strand protein